MDINVTLLGEVITFLIFVWIVAHFIWPYIIKAMQDRQKKIAEGLEAAERGEHTLELARRKSVEIISDSHKQASEIVDEANSRANQIVDQAKTRGDEEGKRMIAHAKTEMQQEEQKLREGLRKNMADIVITCAEKVLQKEIDKKVHSQMIDSLIEELEK